MMRMPSSRATIAAGTRPPRVTQTIASNGPAPARRHAHQQLRAEQAVAAVHRLVWKIQLRREQRPLRRLHLHVVVARASRVERRQNGAKTVAPLAVREQMAAIAETAVVVFAALVGV